MYNSENSSRQSIINVLCSVQASKRKINYRIIEKINNRKKLKIKLKKTLKKNNNNKSKIKRITIKKKQICPDVVYKKNNFVEVSKNLSRHRSENNFVRSLK